MRAESVRCYRADAPMFSIRYMLSSKAADVINSLQLVIDLLLPGEGGLELIESLQMIPKYRDVPVIVMSGIEEDKKIDKMAQQAANLGALAYIVKPLSFEKWWPVIQELKKLHIGLMVEAA
jgi:CheY-like chemotaxis protein